MNSRADRPDPQEMLARIERMEQSAEQMLAKFEELQGELGADTVEVYSEDGLIRVKLDGDGHVEETASEAGAAEMTWGMTGFFFEQPYAEGCTTLVEQIDSLAEAIRGGASKLRDSADSYELADADSQSDLDGAAAEIGG